ncbi:MAG: response regulator [Anaerolineales bacterium]
MSTIRVLVADDHEVVRRGLVMVLDLEPDIEVVAEASNGQEAVELVGREVPDVAILDMSMPKWDGPQAARLIKDRYPDVRVMMLSGVEIDALVFDTIEAGVDGYVLKDASPAELSRAIRTVAEGQRYIHAAVTHALIERTGAVKGDRKAQIDLSRREMDVLRLLASAATYREIGEQLYITEETVRSHVKRILAKLGQPNRTQAVVAALRAGLITLD